MTNSTEYYHLLFIEDAQGQRTIRLNAVTYSIGRDASDTIQVIDPCVSRHHAMLIRVPSEERNYTYRMIDGDFNGRPSKNGTLINGSEYAHKELAPNDQIMLGKQVKLTYFVGKFTHEEFCLYCDEMDIELRSIQEKKLDPTTTLFTELLNASNATPLPAF